MIASSSGADAESLAFQPQHLPIFRHTPAFLDRLWASHAVLKLASKKQIKVDPAALGDMTVSMLRGMEGHQRKEVLKMLRWLNDLPRFDAINLPFTLLIGLARPLREALRARLPWRCRCWHSYQDRERC